MKIFQDHRRLLWPTSSGRIEGDQSVDNSFILQYDTKRLRKQLQKIHTCLQDMDDAPPANY